MKLTIEKQIEKEELLDKGLKKCPKCDKPKPLSEFGKNSGHTDRLQARCKEHDKQYMEIYYQKNKEKLLNCQTENNFKNKEKISTYKKEYYIENREKILIQRIEYDTKPENKIKRKAYVDQNREKITKKQRNRRKTNINYKVLDVLRRRLNGALKGKNKSKNTLALLGCSVDELKQHLEAKFTKGMSWDNHSFYGWHIDHIKPCSKFDLSKESEQIACFHFTNLQPLWMRDNLKKGSKYVILKKS